MKLGLKIFLMLLAGYFMLSLMGCVSGPSNVHYGASVHYNTGWGGGYYGGYPPHYRPPPPHRPPPGHRPPSSGRPPSNRPPGSGGPRPTPLPSGGRR